jgi:hypothetical protein
MQLKIDNDFQHKFMRQEFAAPTTIDSDEAIKAWREAWMTALKSWHSPYKAMIDVRALTVAPGAQAGLERMLKLFGGMFLRKVVGFGRVDGQGHELLPFPVVADEDAARAELGLRGPATPRSPTDFRSLIQVGNDFQRHVVDLSFAQPVTLATKEQVATLKSKLMNNLMQWHSKWNLLIDCANLELAPDVTDDVTRMLKALRGFFMKDVVGFGVRAANASYPFDVVLSRHKAVLRLEAESVSGDKAVCRSSAPAPKPAGEGG